MSPYGVTRPQRNNQHINSRGLVTLYDIMDLGYYWFR